MGKTEENLMSAFAGESQANRRYLAFAKKADAEGYHQVARLFRAAAEAETVHAHAHLKVAGKVGSTLENVREAIGGESYEFKTMYPEFIEVAKKEGNDKALESFAYANQVEKIHAGLYQEALKALEAGKDLPDTAYYVCPVCGNTMAMGEAPDKCPICKAPKAKFTVVS